MKDKKDTHKKRNDDRIDYETITDDKIEEWVGTSMTVLRVLREENEKVYEAAYKEFVLDLLNLKNNKRITDNDYDNVLEEI